MKTLKQLLSERPQETIVVVVDMLNDFVGDEDGNGALVVPGARKLIPNIRDVVREAMSRGVYVCYVNDAHSPQDREFRQFPPHAIHGTYGAQVVQELRPNPKENCGVIQKTTFGVEASHPTRPHQYFGFKHYIFTGVATEYCILVNAKDALRRNKKVTLLTDCIAGVDTVACMEAMLMLGQKGVQYCRSWTVRDVKLTTAQRDLIASIFDEEMPYAWCEKDPDDNSRTIRALVQKRLIDLDLNGRDFRLTEKGVKVARAQKTKTVSV